MTQITKQWINKYCIYPHTYQVFSFILAGYVCVYISKSSWIIESQNFFKKVFSVIKCKLLSSQLHQLQTILYSESHIWDTCSINEWRDSIFWAANYFSVLINSFGKQSVSEIWITCLINQRPYPWQTPCWLLRQPFIGYLLVLHSYRFLIWLHLIKLERSVYFVLTFCTVLSPNKG